MNHHSTTTTYERIAFALTGPLGIDKAKVTPGARLNELGLDSLDRADFMAELEDEFHCDVDLCGNPAYEKVSTLSELADAIDKVKVRAA